MLISLQFLLKKCKPFCAIIVLLLINKIGKAQTPAIKTKTLPASEKYHKSKAYKRRWGQHYRKEWHQPVTFPVVDLDTLAGGLTAYKLGGGRQTTTIRLRDKNNREYVLRNIDKTLSRSLPDITKNSFVEDIADDQITFTHPYAALVVAPLAEAAGIMHTNPVIYFVPHQKALGVFNDSVPEALYLFEQRPDEDWSTAENFGNSKNIVGSDKMLRKILEENDHRVNQLSFAKARLFDMLIGDWGRHEDQWRWAEFKKNGQLIYEPVPRDRDNAFTKMDGRMVKLVLSLAHAKHMQDFDYEIKKVPEFNFTARNLDHHLLNEVTFEEWQKIAEELQLNLTDKVIEDAVKAMPAEVYPFSGKSLTAKLKSRRDFLKLYAQDYYEFLASEVEITGSENAEIFEVSSPDDKTTLVNIYDAKKNGEKKEKPFYSRLFFDKETKEIRLFGIGGNDRFEITGPGKKNIKIRIIGGPGEDVYQDMNNHKEVSSKTIIYDDKNNSFQKNRTTKLKISPENKLPKYVYDNFLYNKSGMDYIAWYSNEDPFHIGFGYKRELQTWNKKPYGKKEAIALRYSLSQKAFSFSYDLGIPKLIGNWDFTFNGNYDRMRWTNFYGIGNNTKRITNNKVYYRARSREYEATVGLSKKVGDYQRLGIQSYFQTHDFLQDTARFLEKQSSIVDEDFYDLKNYVGIKIFHLFQKLNDSILPVKGIQFLNDISFSKNINNTKNEIVNAQTNLILYFPLFKNISLKNKITASHVFGKPEFFQLNTLGGSESIRGFYRDRFYGESTATLQNDLRYITNVNSYYYKGKIGFYGLFDVGRVWLKNENSDKLHYSYGAGILLSPFNKFSVTGSIAFGNDGRFNLHFNYFKPF